MSIERQQQQPKATAEVVAIMNHIRQRYVETRPANGTKGQKFAYAEMFCQILEHEVLDFAQTTQEEEYDGAFAP